MKKIKLTPKQITDGIAYMNKIMLVPEDNREGYEEFENLFIELGYELENMPDIESYVDNANEPNSFANPEETSISKINDLFKKMNG